MLHIKTFANKGNISFNSVFILKYLVVCSVLAVCIPGYNWLSYYGEEDKPTGKVYKKECSVLKDIFWLEQSSSKKKSRWNMQAVTCNNSLKYKCMGKNKIIPRLECLLVGVGTWIQVLALLLLYAVLGTCLFWVCLLVCEMSLIYLQVTVQIKWDNVYGIIL